MIRVARPQPAPDVLRERGPAATAALCAAFEADPDGFSSGARRFPFDAHLYGARPVREALASAQHGKCCYCEAKVRAVAHGDVEHYRPKGAVAAGPGEAARSTGYYWLVYDWANLFFSCQVCNQSHKRDRFPLRDPTARARTHRDDLTQEEPLIVAPDGDPEAHIRFVDEEAVGRTAAGWTTIDLLGLNRPVLREERLRALVLRRLLDRVSAQGGLEPGLADELAATAEAHRRESAAFAGMHRADG